MKKLTSASIDVHRSELPTSRVRISDYSLYDDELDDEQEPSEAPASLYSNMTVVSVTKAAWQEKGMWRGATDNEPGLASSSGTFGRVLNTAVQRKPDKLRQQPHGVKLNLHQFQTDSGDSLGEDPDSWARLKF